MATTVSLRKGLDRKQWEAVNSYPASVGVFGAASTQFDQVQLWVDGNSSHYLYYPTEDSFVQLPPAALSGSFSLASMSAVYHPNGPTGTASAGGAQTITTTLTIPSSLAGYTIRITGGTGAGQEQVILRNTYGANSVITVTSPWTTNPDNTSTYLLITGRFWVLSGLTGSVGLSMYDLALNTWAYRVTTGLGGAVGGGFVATPAFGNTIASGTATSGSATTLVNSGKTWTTDQWKNYQVRIVAGTGAGKVATVTSNTATTLSFATVTTVLDSTSQYVIEPNDDFMYASVSTLTYRYSIAANTWSTLTPGTARTTTLTNGGTYNWIGVTSDPAWADESNIKNGRYIYSFAGGGTVGTANNLAVYDIAANTWINTQLAYGRSGGPGTILLGNFVPSSSATSTVTDREFIYIGLFSSFGALPYYFFRFNTVTNTLEPWTLFNSGVGAAMGPGRLALYAYTDGGTTLRWVYFMANGAAPNPFYRMLAI